MPQTLEVERATALRERRATIRVGCFLPAQYHVQPDGPRAEGRITNLGVQGLGMLGSTDVRVGSDVTVRLFLPEEEHRLSVTGVVRWIEAIPQTQEQCFGIEYAGLDDTARFCLEAYIQGCLHPPRALRGVKRRLHQLHHDLSPELLQAGRLFLVGVAVLSLCAWVIAALR